MSAQIALLDSPFTCSWTRAGSGIEHAHVAVVELDLRDLEFIDSSAVHVILEAAVRAGRGDRDLDRIFTLTRVGDDVEITDIARSERCS